MKEIQYRTFSLRTHKGNRRIKRPNVCQFELTFRCDLRCRHCYSDYYNKEEYIKRELTTSEVKLLIDKVYNSGVIWLCFTGGDPLTRQDFLELYSYAKDRGFLVTIFTNAYSMTKRVADYLKKNPPFVIEITLNATSKELYEFISQIKGSYGKAMKGLNLILERRLPLKIKTQVTKDNLRELPKIKEFIEKLGQKFRPGTILHARLDGDINPCSLRIKPEEVIRLDRGLNLDSIEEECKSTDNQINKSNEQNELNEQSGLSEQNNYFFPCAISSGDSLNIDPYGNIVPCGCIREPKINLLKEDIKEAQEEILNCIRTRNFTKELECRNCSLRNLCYSCPGKALLEKKSLEGIVEWFCELAHLVADGALHASRHKPAR